MTGPAARWIELDAATGPGEPRAVLAAVRTARDVSAGEAIAWLREASGGDVVGFALSADEAPWLRLKGTTPLGPHRAVDLSRAYELRLFDGSRELRWLHEADGRGPAVVLADAGTPLPAGTPIDDPRGPAVAVTRARHLLSGDPRSEDDADGWTRLRSPRYHAACLPVTTPPGLTEPRVLLHSVEYAVTDDHGNLTVVDARLTALDVVGDESLRPPEPPKRSRQENSRA